MSQRVKMGERRRRQRELYGEEIRKWTEEKWDEWCRRVDSTDWDRGPWMALTAREEK